MKTKEEIIELSKIEANNKTHEHIKLDYQDGIYYGFQQGYTRCQEDMQKDVEYWQGESDHWYKQAVDMADKKKYTEEDMIAFAYQFSSINVADFRKHLKDFDINLNIKNKQD